MKKIVSILITLIVSSAFGQIQENRILNVESVTLMKGNQGRIGLGYSVEGPKGNWHGDPNGQDVKNHGQTIFKDVDFGRKQIPVLFEEASISMLVIRCLNPSKQQPSYVCARLPVDTSVSTLGATVALHFDIMRGFSNIGFKNYNGKTIRQLLGSYYGLQAGAKLILGVKTIPALVNANKVVMHNLIEFSLAMGGEVDLSIVKMDIFPSEKVSYRPEQLNMFDMTLLK